MKAKKPEDAVTVKLERWEVEALLKAAVEVGGVGQYVSGGTLPIMEDLATALRDVS